jgi:hypothetical protein
MAKHSDNARWNERENQEAEVAEESNQFFVGTHNNSPFLIKSLADLTLRGRNGCEKAKFAEGPIRGCLE